MHARDVHLYKARAVLTKPCVHSLIFSAGDLVRVPGLGMLMLLWCGYAMGTSHRCTKRCVQHPVKYVPFALSHTTHRKLGFHNVFI